MTIPRDSTLHGPLLGGIFLLMLVLAASIAITGSSIARRLLVILIPFGGIMLGGITAVEAESTIDIVPAISLLVSGCAATALAIIGAGPFSNQFVDVAIIGSIAGIKFNHPLQATIQTAQQLLN